MYPARTLSAHDKISTRQQFELILLTNCALTWTSAHLAQHNTSAASLMFSVAHCLSHRWLSLMSLLLAHTQLFIMHRTRVPTDRKLLMEARSCGCDVKRARWHTCSSCNMDWPTSLSMLRACSSWSSSPTGCLRLVSDSLKMLNRSKAISTGGTFPCRSADHVMIAHGSQCLSLSAPAPLLPASSWVVVRLIAKPVDQHCTMLASLAES